ncbi:tRNA (adenine(22)-N(1))-methyltransferase [Bacillaceae bacterium W0354]
MNDIQLSDRLLTVANYIPSNINLFADIGTDHAYLPCFICLNHPSINAIAGEVSIGPYTAAVKQVEKMQLQDRIDVRLGDGLSVLRQDEVDCITIAGMGGSLIASILENGSQKLNNIKRLIVQPNIDSQSIREFAVKYSYQIIDEQIINDDGYVYEIIVLEPAKDETYLLSEKERFFGPILLQRKNDYFIEKWRHELDKKKKIIKQMKGATNPDFEKINQFIKELRWIEEEIKK